MAGDSPTIRFGAFELDLRTGELRKAGRKVRIQEQPLCVLVSLLERPGELVTRDELRKKLWQPDTFVDFDTGLNKAITKIREVLADSAASPRFVETCQSVGTASLRRLRSWLQSGGRVEPWSRSGRSSRKGPRR